MGDCSSPYFLYNGDHPGLMFDLGDNLSVEPARIPWVIWIQLLVTFLLFLFLYLLTSFTLDSSNLKTTLSSSSSASPSTPPFLSPNSTPLPIVFSDTSLISQVGEQGNEKGDTLTSTRRRIVGDGEDMFERESLWPMHAYFHPCNYFRLARIIFLKCLGLETTSESLSSDRNKSKKT